MPERVGTDWFAWFVSAAFFAMIALLAIRGMDASASDAVLILVGQASGAFAAIISYRYGSTATSEKKSEQITQLAQTAAVTAGTAAAVQAAAHPVVPDPVRVEVVGDVTTSEGRA
jgi:hypothetical protein